MYASMGSRPAGSGEDALLHLLRGRVVRHRGADKAPGTEPGPFVCMQAAPAAIHTRGQRIPGSVLQHYLACDNAGAARLIHLEHLLGGGAVGRDQAACL